MTSKELKKHGGLPLVSVIMPARNEARFIRRSLAAILQQTYPKNLTEVIVVDGMSTDGTRSIIESLSANSDVPVSIVDNPKLIAPSALNRGLERAQGSIIIRIDGHCEITPDYVENCVKLLRAGRADGVGGPIETVGEGPRSRAIAIAMGSTFGVGGSAFRTINDREMYTDTVAFPAYTREIVERAGPFNEELVRNQDDEYNYRIRELGGKILLSPTIRSRYYSRSTFMSLWRQYFQYGYWKVRVLQLHPTQMRMRQFVPFVFVCSLVILAGLSWFTSTAGWVFLVMVMSYMAANLVAAIIRARGTPALIPGLSWSFVLLHLSYGIGSLWGLFAFASRWQRTGTGRSGTKSPYANAKCAINCAENRR